MKYLLPLVALIALGAGCSNAPAPAVAPQPAAVAPSEPPPRNALEAALRAQRDAAATSTAVSHDITLGDLTFTIPENWSVTKTSAETGRVTASLRVPDPKYHVDIPLSVRPIGPKENISLEAKDLLATSSGKVSVYADTCAPSLACYYAVKNGKRYAVVFEVPDSDEPTPKDLDGVWFPSTTLTTDEMLAVMKTTK